MAPSKNLEEYLHLFASLNRAPNARLGRAPHKPVLLLTLLEAVDQGLVNGNFVPITPELAALFRQNLRRCSVKTGRRWCRPEHGTKK